MVIDRIIALCLLITVLPIILLACLLVLIEDGRPLFFIQLRLGKNEKPFYMVKIRSMKKYTPQVSSNELKNPEKYVLKVGRFLRKFSIDELPNLFNIIKGDMVFIGPRPLVASETKLQNLRRQYGILDQKPGLTGLAQINGRDLVTIEEKVALERIYKRDKSLVLKIKIILKTILIVFRSAGVRF
jgi:O-antigen biosynthesis protein WbqP